MIARVVAVAALVILMPTGATQAQTIGDQDSARAVALVAEQQPAPGTPVVQPPPQGGARRPDQPNQPRPGGQAPAPPPPPPAVSVAAPPRQGQSFNIKVDVTISEQTGASPAAKKTVSIVSGENMPGFVRSQAAFGGSQIVLPGTGGGFLAPLNVDVEPTVLADGKIRLGLSVQYDVPAPPSLDSSGRAVESQAAVRSALGSLTRTEVRQNLRIVLESGKPLVVSQAADPVGDRKVTIEVTATILK